MMGEVTDAREIKNTFIVPAIKSSDHYDCSRAKIYCSLTWLVAKAFGKGRWCSVFINCMVSFSLSIITSI